MLTQNDLTQLQTMIDKSVKSAFETVGKKIIADEVRAVFRTEGKKIITECIDEAIETKIKPLIDERLDNAIGTKIKPMMYEMLEDFFDSIFEPHSTKCIQQHREIMEEFKRINKTLTISGGMLNGHEERIADLEELFFTFKRRLQQLSS